MTRCRPSRAASRTDEIVGRIDSRGSRWPDEAEGWSDHHQPMAGEHPTAPGLTRNRWDDHRGPRNRNRKMMVRIWWNRGRTDPMRSRTDDEHYPKSHDHHHRPTSPSGTTRVSLVTSDHVSSSPPVPVAPHRRLDDHR